MLDYSLKSFFDKSDVKVKISFVQNICDATLFEAIEDIYYTLCSRLVDNQVEMTILLHLVHDIVVFYNHQVCMINLFLFLRYVTFNVLIIKGKHIFIDKVPHIFDEYTPLLIHFGVCDVLLDILQNVLIIKVRQIIY
jgi:hypothetical protein